MKFELLLARRYLSAQRRHSVLTVCSIVIAVALLTALSTCFSTIRGIFRDASFDEDPYHVLLYDVTEAQCRQVEKMNHIGSCTFVPLENGQGGDARILFDSYIGSLGRYISEMNRSLNRKGSGGYAMNRELISLDLIDDDSRAQAVMTYTVFVIFLMFFALGMRMLIDTAFEVSSKERERQFGVLRSIGATPRQILNIQSFEGILLSMIAVPLGCLTGIGTAYLIFRAVLSTGIASYYLEAEKIPQIVRVHLSPLLIACSAVIGIMWVFFSAYGTGMRNAKRSPVLMITSRAGGVKRVRNHGLSGLLFGWTGRLAARNARREKKRFVITVLALTV
ncbi:MAG: FtsX-like permease family protein, partial [Oscillospiraceae bacterium]|nr:FtsX-like permease family protein [Oscillospiraceae bacterium]